MPFPRALRATCADADSSCKKSSNRVSPRRWGVRGLSPLALAGLVAFHAVLLVERFADSSIAHPEVLAQWLGALLLGAGAMALRRQGNSLVSGRSALVFWLLVLLLHVGFGTGIALTGEEIGSSRELLLLLPFAAFTLSAASRPSARGGSRRSEAALHFAAGDLRFPLFDPCPAASSAGSGPDRFSPRPPPFS